MTETTPRLTAEREAEIREYVGWQTPHSQAARDLLAELDATRAERVEWQRLWNEANIHRELLFDMLERAKTERDEAVKANEACKNARCDGWSHSAGLSNDVTRLSRELEAARTPTDEMVERAAREIYNDANHLIKWDDPMFAYRDDYISTARRALTAALGGER